MVIFELGTFAVELRSRWGRSGNLGWATASTRSALLAGDLDGASRSAATLARSSPMSRALSVIVSNAWLPGGEHRLSKALADFDFDAQRRLDLTRLLVRAGPALGLMGTLISLSLALTGPARGNVERLSSNLRVAFSVTVLGLLVGAVAFGLSLYRDRMYGQDLSDLEYVAAVVSDPRELPEPPRPAPAVAESHLAGRRASTPTGGERRRVHLARAVSVQPEILLLDEPFAGLDAATRAALLDDTGAALRAWSGTTLGVVHDRRRLGRSPTVCW